MRIVVRKFRSRQRRPDWEQIKAELVRTMEQQIAPRFAGYAERIVASWRHKITFKTSFKVSKTMVAVYVYPIGGNAKFWRWTSRGTEPHRIRPRRAKVLAYQHIWTPKTRGGGHYRGAGTKTGPWVYSMYEDHPGTKPRHFEERWAEWSRRWFKPTVEKTIRRAIRRASRAAEA